MAVQGHVMVIDFGTSGQGIYDFLLVINSNYCQGNVIAGQQRHTLSFITIVLTCAVSEI